MKPRTAVGVHAYASPSRLLETVASVHSSAWAGTEVVLLVDGPDEDMAEALRTESSLAALRTFVTDEAQGASSCFNRVVAGTDAEVVVFVESGTVLAPHCLERLAEALEHPGRGLAGPSTNRAANEQGLFRSGRPSDIVRTGALARQRFGASVRSLEPRHNLADFCLAVSRRAIDSIGLADEEYGLGPGWSMDYNVRAARAGYRGVWVGAAYAYRYPPTERWLAAEATYAERSRRLYQDRFCGLRRGAEDLPYEAQCRGDACEHFAPVGAVRLQVPAVKASGGPQAGAVEVPAVGARSAAMVPAGRARSSMPLVSAIMPTRGRPDFALQAVRYFQSQDYERKELIILEDGDRALLGRLPDDPRIRHVAAEGSGRSIGSLRNEACSLARGDILAHWDDDDWYGPERLSRQVAAIQTGEADITALQGSLMFDLAGWRFWRCKPQLHRHLFVRDVHGGTLVYRRQVWADKAQFPDRSLAEDAVFLDQAVRRGARLRPVDAEGIFVYVRHGANAWDLSCGVTGGASGWERWPEPAFPAEDREFYRRFAAAGTADHGPALVSCVMPTFDRRWFVGQAARYFLAQDYPSKELVVLDDGPEPVRDLLPSDPRIVYHRIDKRMVLGAKRNLACELAKGPVIMHWDDDDWASPRRISTQVEVLNRGNAEICGASNLLYFEPARSTAWRFTWPANARPWAAGPSLCFRKDFWARSRFPEVALGEDTRFVFNPAVHRVADVGDSDCLVGIIHRRNTAAKAVRGVHWQPRPVSEVERLLGDDIAFYHNLGKTA